MHLHASLLSIASSPGRPRTPSLRIASQWFCSAYGRLDFRRSVVTTSPAELALRKGLALLVYLAEANGPVGRDAVATMLWPESSEEVVRARLRRLLHRLQLTLGDVLTSDRSTVRWSSAIDLQVDSRLFEQACDRGEFERACHLYRGDFLEGFSPGDCPQFDEWAFFRREGLAGPGDPGARAGGARQACGRRLRRRSRACRPSRCARSAQRSVWPAPHPQSPARRGSGRGRAPPEGPDTASSRRARRGARSRDPRAVERRRNDAGRGSAADAICRAAATCISRSRPTAPGRIDILLLPGFVSHVERIWEEPRLPDVPVLPRRDGPSHPARSSRHRPFRPGRIQPQRRRNRAGHRHRA